MHLDLVQNRVEDVILSKPGFKEWLFRLTTVPLSGKVAVLRIRIRIRWIRKILASWIRIHGSGSKGRNINQKLKKKNFTLKTQV